MSGLLNRAKRLERKAQKTTSNKRKLQWLRDMFDYVKTDTTPPDGFFPKGTETLRRTFFEDSV